MKGIEIDWLSTSSMVVNTIAVIEGKNWLSFTIAIGHRRVEGDNEDTWGLVRRIPWQYPVYFFWFSLY